MKTNREWLNELAANDVDALQARVNELEAELTARELYPNGFVSIADMTERVGKLESENTELKAWLDGYVGKSGMVSVLSDGKLCTGPKALTDRINELQAERDSLEHELSETEAKFAKEMAETLSLHSKQQAASHQAWVDAVDERDYWKQEVQYCMNAAYPPSHAPERPYNPHVMDYPPSDAYTNPSTMVSAVIDGLRDEKAAEWMGVLKQLKETQTERDRYRELASELLDAAHNMQLIADRGLA